MKGEIIDELRKVLQESNNIVFFGGAGVSTESGVPDFRSADGLYKAQSEFGMSPETMISHTFFMRDTETFFKYYKSNLIYQDAQPNDAHKALAKLEEMGKLKAVVTQNIDGLHQAAGSKTVYELHGSVASNYCMDCGAFYDLDYIMDPENCGEGSAVPRCKNCGGIVKPDVVLYEEGLDDAVVSGAIHAISKADLMIVAGTSLTVYPAAGLLQYFRGSHLVLINRDATPMDRNCDLVIRDPVGKVLGSLA
jgi:NAD-dependent deacetylase